MNSFTMIRLVGLIIILYAINWKIRTAKADEKPQNTEHLRERAAEKPQNTEHLSERADENPQNTEHLRELVERAMEYLREGLEKEQEKNAVGFDIPNTKNRGVIFIEKDYEEEMWIRVGVCRRGTDLMVNHFYTLDTLENIKDFLEDKANVDQVINSITELSCNVDKRM